jgi:Flp pilus assembly pilin Flp
MMNKNLIKRWTAGVRDLRSDERGAEATEVILILVVVVVALMAVFAGLRKALQDKTTDVTNCIKGAKTATDCG